MIKPGQLLLLIVNLSVALMACTREPDPCLQPRTVAARILFKKAIESDTGAIVTDSALPNAIIGILDSPLAFKLDKNSSEFSFVPSPLADSTTIYVIPDSAKRFSAFGKDTITFYYERRLSFISTPCGYAYHYFLTNLRHTTYGIDSVKIDAPDVNGNINTQHVKVYY